MKTMAVNHELRFSCPDGFYELDAEAKSTLNFYGNGEYECFSNPEGHIMISIGWNPMKGLAALAGVASAVKNAEQRISKAMQPFGYRLLNTEETILDGEAAKGFHFEYEAQGIAMVGESYACRRNKTMYYLHVYYRKALQEESAPVWKDILASMRWM